MNKWGVGNIKTVPKMNKEACFARLPISGKASKKDSHIYYEIAKMFGDDINNWFLNMAKKLFHFSILENNNKVILVRVPLHSNRVINLSKMTFLRYIDENELDNTKICDITLRAFQLKDVMPDFHALVVAHYIHNTTEGDGHYITKTPHTIWYGKFRALPSLITLSQLKDRFRGKVICDSVHEFYAGNSQVRKKHNNESPEDYYKEIVKIP